jgi:hypothetical protein
MARTTLEERLATLEAEVARLKQNASHIHDEPGGGQPLTGREHLQLLEDSGFVGVWKERTDIGDSTAFTRRLRESVESRADRFDQEEPTA